MSESEEQESARVTPDRPGSIGQIAIPVSDMARARDFYRDTLGLKHLFDAPGLSFLECGGVRLMLAEPEGDGPPEPEKASIIYYRVGDVEAAHGRMVEQGARSLQEPGVVHRTDAYELRMAFLEDSEGNPLGLMREVPLEG